MTLIRGKIRKGPKIDQNGTILMRGPFEFNRQVLTLYEPGLAVLTKKLPLGLRCIFYRK